MIRLAVIVLTIALSVSGCADQSAPEQPEAEAAQGVRVTLVRPRQQSLDYVLTALGSVESIHHPTLSAETSGQIVSIEVSEGQAVTSQQLLATIDSTLHGIEADKALAELQRQEVLLDNQRREVDRLLQLARSQSVSKDTLEDEQAQLLMLTALRDVAKKQRQQALYLESKTRVLAPREGLIARRHVSLGDYVTPGQALFKLVSVDKLRARLAFPEHRAAGITVGKQVELISPVAVETVAAGKVTSINPQINPANRAIDVIVEFDNPGGWYPGASVDATLMVERKADALTVPTLSVVRRSGADVVFVVSNGRASQRQVALGWRKGDRVEIVDGLTAQDVIVAEGAALIADGSALLTSQDSTAP